MESTELHARLKQKLALYKPSQETIALVQQTPTLLLVGISGAGKDSITKELLKTGKYHVLVSYTTRNPRENNGVMERDGVEYHFITLEQSEQMVDAGAYVEANLYGSNVYGTGADEIKAAYDAGKIAVTDMEVQGVDEYMHIGTNAKAVFILPPSYDVWQSRLARRYGESMDQADFEKRMATALQEIEHALRTPYFSFVVNDSLADAAVEIDKLASGQPETAEKEAAHGVANALAHSLKLSIATHQSATV